MGTRHLIVIVYQGRWVVCQYCQFDGYPEGSGEKIVKLLRSDKDFIPKLINGLQYVYEPDNDGEGLFTPEVDAAMDRLDKSEMDADGRLVEAPFYKFTRDPVSNFTPDLWEALPSMQVRTGPGILVLITKAGPEQRVPVFLNREFANDGLFCEWAYVIDLDADELEIYGGHTSKKPEHRFVDIGDRDSPVPRFLASVPFAELDDYNSGRKSLSEMVYQERKALRVQRREARGEIETDGEDSEE